MFLSLRLKDTVALEKAARDAGFDHIAERSASWLCFKSSTCPLTLWLACLEGALYLAAFSQANLAEALRDYGTPFASPLPEAARSGCTCPDIEALYQLLRRAYTLSKTLPNELLYRFQQITAELPRSTEVERLRVERVGQRIFREGLVDYWQGRCAITGLSVGALLRASHIKPWAACQRDEERLDVYNGLLLAAHLDAAFDRGLISVANSGQVLISPQLSADARRILNLNEPLVIKRLSKAHFAYLAWHQAELFQS